MGRKPVTLDIPDSVVESAKSFKTLVGEPYTTEDRMNAAFWWVQLGTTVAVAQKLGFPQKTIWKWTKTEWFQEAIAEIKHQFGVKMASKYARIMEKAADEIMERLENGDWHRTKSGQVRVPIPAREMGFLMAIAHDKRSLIEGPYVPKGDTNVDKRLAETQEKLRELSSQVNAKIIDASTIHVESSTIHGESEQDNDK